MGEPSDYDIVQVHLVTVSLDHKFSENLQFRSAFTGRFEYSDNSYANLYDDVGLPSGGKIIRYYSDRNFSVLMKLNVYIMLKLF